MALYVIVTPFIGQFLIFLIFPVLVLPISKRNSSSPTTRAPADERQSAVLSLWSGD